MKPVTSIIEIHWNPTESELQSYPPIMLYGYESIPINTIFRGMNIHLPGFDPLPYIVISCENIWNKSVIAVGPKKGNPTHSTSFQQAARLRAGGYLNIEGKADMANEEFISGQWFLPILSVIRLQSQ